LEKDSESQVQFDKTTHEIQNSQLRELVQMRKLRYNSINEIYTVVGHTRLKSRMISICFILFLLISILTSSYGQVTCPSGWDQYGGSCYLFRPYFNSGSIDGTWDQCYAYCTASYPGATMFCVNDADENHWLRVKSYGNWKWLGYTDMPPYGGGCGLNL
jgi:hypothetical protein